jgi:hypothetical protein
MQRFTRRLILYQDVVHCKLRAAADTAGRSHLSRTCLYGRLVTREGAQTVARYRRRRVGSRSGRWRGR